MSATEGPFHPVDLSFMPANMAGFQFDSNPADAANPGGIMWGGMEQMSLDKSDTHGIDPELFGYPQHLQQQGAYSIRQHGQITPPNDDVDGSLVDAKPLQQQLDELPQQQQPTPEKSNRGSKGSSSATAAKKKRPSHRKKTASAAAAADAERSAASDSPKPKKTTRKARKGYKATTKEEEDDTDGEIKRERFLERNRVAASKCRMKKKEWTSDLESQARDLAAANAQLHAHALSLKEEVLFLKSECLKHTDCGCDRIRQYLDRSIAGMNPSGVLGMMPAHQQHHFFDSPGAGSAAAGTTASSTTGATESGSGTQSASSPGDEMTSDAKMQAMLQASIDSPSIGGADEHEDDFGMDLSS